MIDSIPEGFRAPNGGLRVNLGCGAKPRAGFLGVDSGEHTRAEMRMDVLDFLTRLPPESVQEVYSRHMLEHLEPAALRALLRELDRVLRPGGRMRFIVPHHSNPYFHADPTHRQAFAVHTFCYFCEEHGLSRKVPAYVAMAGWRLHEVRLRFVPMGRPRLFGLRLPMLSDLLNPLVNLRPLFIELFERYLAGVFSIYELSVVIDKRAAAADARP